MIRIQLSGVLFKGDYSLTIYNHTLVINCLYIVFVGVIVGSSEVQACNPSYFLYDPELHPLMVAASNLHITNQTFSVSTRSSTPLLVGFSTMCVKKILLCPLY